VAPLHIAKRRSIPLRKKMGPKVYQRERGSKRRRSVSLSLPERGDALHNLYGREARSHLEEESDYSEG